jgi:outer membrane immunogenic protein
MPFIRRSRNLYAPHALCRALPHLAPRQSFEGVFMKYRFLTAVLLAGSAIAPAAAQPGTFTGPRVEGIVGYDVLRSGEEEDGVATGDNEGDESIDGVAYGVGVGYDFDLGGVVVGVEGEYVDSTGEQEFGETVDGTEFLGRIETGRDLYLGARIGVPVTPRTLLYAKGGYTNTSIESAFTSDTDSVDFDTTVDGYRVGAGIEQMLGSNAYVKAEYRYSNYNGLQFDDDLFGDEDIDIDLDRHQVVAGIGLRF